MRSFEYVCTLLSEFGDKAYYPPEGRTNLFYELQVFLITKTCEKK